jgi:protein-tyrosine-phosphatase
MASIDLKNVKSMLFVCLGNTCRSPAAEGLARKFARDAFPPALFERLRIESAGLNHAFTGAQPQSIRFVKQLAGEDISGHRSRTITASMAKEFDLIVVMETYMRDSIASHFPDIPAIRSKVFTLKELCADELHPSSLDIEDPYMMPDAFYLEIITEIRDFARCLVSRWTAARKLAR